MVITASPTTNLETLELKIRLSVAVLEKIHHDDSAAIHQQSVNIARLSKERSDFVAARRQERAAANKRGLCTTTPDGNKRRQSKWQHGSSSAPRGAMRHGVSDVAVRALGPELQPRARASAGRQSQNDVRVTAERVVVSKSRSEPRLGGPCARAPDPLKRAVMKRTAAARTRSQLSRT